MTRLEKAKELYPEMTEDEIINYSHCPESLIGCETVECPDAPEGVANCVVCWNMEYEVSP